MQQGLELKADALAGQRMLEAEIRSSEVRRGEERSDMELLEEDCRQGSAYELNQESSIRAGAGSGCLR